MKSQSFCCNARLLPAEKRPAYRLALLSCLLVTALGIVYFVYMVIQALTGDMTMPPPEEVQLFGGVATLLAALLMPVLFCSVHFLVDKPARVYTLLAVVFCAAFTVFTGINRFVQLSVVRLSVLEGKTEGLARFLPYDGRSAMFALEIGGWGVFMSLASLFLAFALGGKGLRGAARAAFLAYVPLGLMSAVCYVLDSPLSIVGFAAWGFVLFVATGLLLFSLVRYDRHWAAAVSKTG